MSERTPPPSAQAGLPQDAGPQGEGGDDIDERLFCLPSTSMPLAILQDPRWKAIFERSDTYIDTVRLTVERHREAGDGDEMMNGLFAELAEDTSKQLMRNSILYDLVCENAEDLGIDLKKFDEKHRSIVKTTPQGRQERSDLKKHLNALNSRWPAALTFPELKEVLSTAHGARMFLKAVKEAPSTPLLMRRMSAAMLQRLQLHPGRGIRTDQCYIGADCDKVAQSFLGSSEDPKIVAITFATHDKVDEAAKKLGFEKNRNTGWYSVPGRYPSIDWSQGQSDPSASEPSQILGKRARTDDATGSEDEEATADPHEARRARLADDMLFPPYHEESSVSDDDSDDNTIGAPDAAEEAAADHGPVSDDSSDNDTIGMPEATEESAADHTASPRITQWHSCNSSDPCKTRFASGLPYEQSVKGTFLDKLNKMYDTRPSKPDEAATLELLLEFGECLTVPSDSSKYCSVHLQRMGSLVGLRIKGVKHDQLRSMLYDYSRGRDRLWSAKTDRVEHNNFLRSRRPAVPSDELVTYRFPSAKGLDIDSFVKTEQGRARLMMLAGVDDHQWDKYQRDGTINLNLFSWWEDEGILEPAKQEFDMYRWHLRAWNGADHNEWNRIMFFSVVQQLMRQDIRYWAAHVLFRSDRAWRLVSCPYYTKFAVPGDSISPRYLDRNIQHSVEGSHETRQVYSSLCLDAESDESCVEIVRGMHKEDVKNNWADRLADRGLIDTADIYDVKDKELTEQDLKDFGNKKWKTVRCNALAVRMTDPAIPHRARKPGRHVQESRTLFPWFTAVDEDGETLEVPNAGTFADIAAAHRTRQPSKSTPSGLRTKHGVPPWPFPASVSVGHLSPLSDALVAQREYDDIEVSQYMEELLTGPKERVVEMIYEFRATTRAAALKSFRRVQEQEKKSFGQKAYWHFVEVNNGVFPKLDAESEDQPAPWFAPPGWVPEPQPDGNEHQADGQSSASPSSEDHERRKDSRDLEAEDDEGED